MEIVLNLICVHHQFGENKVLHNINLKIEQGQFVSLVGASGCGKSTLFRAILGTLHMTKGDVLVDDSLVEGPNRRVGTVFQHYSLYTGKTVLDNVAIGLKWDQTTIPGRLFHPMSWRRLRQKHLFESREMLKKVHLGEEQFYKYPDDLSGGQQQRVAIAQAMVMRPKLILLDEPFGALDESTRASAQRMLNRMYLENVEAKEKGEAPPHTVIIVTHELSEALIVATRLIGLSRNWEIPFSATNPKLSGKELGATIVYDRKVPVFTPETAREDPNFLKQKDEVRKVVLDQDSPPIDPNEYVTFWREKACVPR